MSKAALPSQTLQVLWRTSMSNSAYFNCNQSPWTLEVTSTPYERAATMYRGLRGLGFLFPHPRRQISPTLNQIKAQCGKTFPWKPVLKHRGLHLHTLHPNEWVRGFFMDRPDVALSIVRWSARNGLNLLDISLLREPLTDIAKKFAAPFKLARELGVHTGVSLGVALQQQNSYKLLNLFEALTGWGAETSLDEGLLALFANLDVSFIVLEAGTSEFTPTDPAQTISWLNRAEAICRGQGKALFTKVHVSSNQHSKEYGNFNFLPAKTHEGVGILPHTVMFYGLEDLKAPMYGNENFTHIRDFMLAEAPKRHTWYYPESGYWVAMDVDIPLLLTDYLRTRASDLALLAQHEIDGQLIFSTGHALGGWLYDWTQALLIDADHRFDPLIGITLLGEDRQVWEKIMEHQRVHFKEQGAIRLLSSANLQDELSSTHRIHDRFTMKELSKNPSQRESEINQLSFILSQWPLRDEIKDEELARMLTITRLRIEHAKAIRQALRMDTQRQHYLAQAVRVRMAASELLSASRTDDRNYADLGMMDEWNNPSSYQFGYVYPAASLYFWRREERMIAEDFYFPFVGNIYDIWDILF